MTHRYLTTVFIALLLSAAQPGVVSAAETDIPDELFLDEDLLDAIEQDVLALLPPKNHSRLSAGRDNAGNTQLNVGVQLVALDDWLVDVAAGKSNLNDSDPAYSTRSLQVGFGGAAHDGFNWYAGFSNWGKSGAIKTEDGVIELGYHQRKWWASLQYQQGDVTLYLAPRFSSRRSAISSGRDALGATVGYSGDNGRGWLSWLHRRYDRDVSRINTSVLLQQILQSIALDQAYALTRDEYSAGYQWYWRHADARVEFNRTISAVDGAGSDFVSLSLRYSLDASLSIDAGLLAASGSDLTTLTFGIGLSW